MNLTMLTNKMVSKGIETFRVLNAHSSNVSQFDNRFFQRKRISDAPKRRRNVAAQASVVQPN
jgi:hypothetical protein